MKTSKSNHEKCVHYMLRSSYGKVICKMAFQQLCIKPLKNTCEWVYIWYSCRLPACNFIKNWTLSQVFFKDLDCCRAPALWNASIKMNFMDLWILFKEATSESCSTEIGVWQEAILNLAGLQLWSKSLKNILVKVNLRLKSTKKGLVLQIHFKDLTIVVKGLFCKILFYI